MFRKSAGPPLKMVLFAKKFTVKMLYLIVVFTWVAIPSIVGIVLMLMFPKCPREALNCSRDILPVVLPWVGFLFGLSGGIANVLLIWFQGKIKSLSMKSNRNLFSLISGLLALIITSQTFYLFTYKSIIVYVTLVLAITLLLGKLTELRLFEDVDK